jgi:phage baseplate assembly protein W
MSFSFYKIPLELSAALSGNDLPTCDLVASVSNNVELIIMTKFGEHRSNSSFGCEIWDLDFELIISEKKWEEKLRQSLLKSITNHERRISDVKLNVEITEIEKYSSLRQFTEIKKRVKITLLATIVKTGEAFTYSTNLFLSPLSVD